MGDLANLFGGGQYTGTQLGSPFGNMPYGLAQNFSRQFAGPLAQQLGFGGGGPQRQAQRQESLANATGPLADYIRQTQGLSQTLGPEAAQIGQQVSAQGSAAYQQLQSQIQQALGSLPGLQGIGEEGLGAAEQGLGIAESAVPGFQQALGYGQQYAQEAFSPTRDTPLFQEASRRLLDTIRPGLAARGLLDSGAGQAAESDATRDLVFNFAQQQRQDQASAVPLLGQAAGGLLGAGQGVQGAGGALQGAAGSQFGLQSAGLPVAQAGSDAVGQLGQYLQAQYGIPMQALSGLFQMLSGAAAPTSQLLGQTAPQYTPIGGPVAPFGIRK